MRHALLLLRPLPIILFLCRQEWLGIGILLLGSKPERDTTAKLPMRHTTAHVGSSRRRSLAQRRKFQKCSQKNWKPPQ